MFTQSALSSPLLAVLTWTCSRMSDDNLSGPGVVSATQVLWRMGQFQSQFRNVYNWRDSLGTPGYLTDNLDFIELPTCMHLAWTGFSLLPGKPVILGSLSSYLREERVNTHTHTHILQSENLHEMAPGLVFFSKLHKWIWCLICTLRKTAHSIPIVPSRDKLKG